jgi:hypothetical protein
LIKDFERVAKSHKGKLRFCLVVKGNNQVSRGLSHNLGVFFEVPLPTLRIMEFGEYKHVLEKRRMATLSMNPEHGKKFDYKNPHKKKHKLHQKKQKQKFRHKTKKERLEQDRPSNHPAHKSTSREVKKYKSDDLTREGITRFVDDYLDGKTTHYHQADHLPPNNDKLLVKYLNSYNYEEFIKDTIKEKKMAVIWTCLKGSSTYPGYYKQIKHLAKHKMIQQYFKFGKLDPQKNDHPKEYKGNVNANKLFVYRDESKVDKHWKSIKYEDMAKVFKTLIFWTNEIQIIEAAERDL